MLANRGSQPSLRDLGNSELYPALKRRAIVRSPPGLLYHSPFGDSSSAGLLLWFLFEVAVDEEIVKAAEHKHRATDPHGEVMQFAFHRLFVLAEFDADVTKDRAPDSRAENGEERKQFVIHPHDTGGDANQMAHDGQQARNENAHGAIVRSPVLCAFDFIGRNQDELSVTHEEWAAGETRGPVHQSCAQPRADGSRDDNSSNAQWNLAGMREVSGGRNDDFARQRQDGTFRGHEQRYERVAAAAQRVCVPVDDVLEHAAVVIAEMRGSANYFGEWLVEFWISCGVAR